MHFSGLTHLKPVLFKRARAGDVEGGRLRLGRRGPEDRAQEGVRVTGGPTVPLFDEKTVTVRITPDRSLADFFVQGGRWATHPRWS